MSAQCSRQSKSCPRNHLRRTVNGGVKLAVREAKGEGTAQLLDHLKKPKPFNMEGLYVRNEKFVYMRKFWAIELKN